MAKNNGSNNMPGWAKRDIQMLKRVSVSLVDTVRQTRREMAGMHQEMVEMHRENQRRSVENGKILAELLRRNDGLEEQTAYLKEQTASLKRTSDIHSKAILKILDRI